MLQPFPLLIPDPSLLATPSVESYPEAEEAPAEGQEKEVSKEDSQKGKQESNPPPTLERT